MRPIRVSLLVPLLVVALAAGCAKQEEPPPAEPAGKPAAEGAHPALNKLEEARGQLNEVDRKKREQNQQLEQGGEAP